MSRGRDYTPPPATARELIKMLHFLKIDRVVVVTPTIYDTGDNAATMDAIGLIGRGRARGVGLADESASRATLDSMKSAGICGVRLFPASSGELDVAAATKKLQAKIGLARPYDWHIEISTPPDVIVVLAAQLAASPVPIVLDTFGWLEGGIQQQGFRTIRSLLQSGRIYVKLSEPYRISKIRPDYPDLTPLVHALVAANPDRLLWGSGWPYVDSASVPGRKNSDLAPDLPEHAGHLLDLFAGWVPDAGTRRKILVENPARLFGF